MNLIDRDKLIGPVFHAIENGATVHEIENLVHNADSVESVVSKESLIKWMQENRITTCGATGSVLPYGKLYNWLKQEEPTHE